MPDSVADQAGPRGAERRGRAPTENDLRAAAAVGKNLVVLSEDVDGYELCVPEDGSRPKDSFWRKKKKEMTQPVSALVAVVRMSGPKRPERGDAALVGPAHVVPGESSSVPVVVAAGTVEEEPRSVTELEVAKLEAETVAPESGVPEPEPSLTRVLEPGPIKLRLLPSKCEDDEVGLERGEKICSDCGLPYPRESGFYTCTSAKDGRQSRCKECDNRRRAEHNQGLHVKASEKDSYEQKAARKRASEVIAVASKSSSYSYKGVSGGFLIYGYVR